MPLSRDNPQSRFEPMLVEYVDGETPEARLEVYEDQSRSILAENTSPDVGFRWSLNAYRGCFHACAYCLCGDTAILMANGRTKRLEEIQVGDAIYGTRVDGRYRRYVKTQVLAHWQTIKPAYRIRMSDGNELIASGDHRFLTRRGWKYVTGSEQGRARRPHLTPNDRFLGPGYSRRAVPDESPDYRIGYLCGMIRGDGLIGTYVYSSKRRATDVQHQFRLALVDLEALRRTKQYLLELDVATHELEFQAARPGYQPLRAIRTNARDKVARVRELCRFPVAPTVDWQLGFLAGIFDAEGSLSCGVLRICNKDPEILDRIKSCLTTFGFSVAHESKPNGICSIRIRGGLKEHLRFLQLTDPAITRKQCIDGFAIKNSPLPSVVSIEPLNRSMRLFDITTGTGDFIANGVVSHNCYARPSHEYLGFGAGTDFERRILVKPRAAELLRETFDAPRWKGELVVVSGNTDAYQKLEARYALTRSCLEVFAEYKNPVHIITKSPLVERDIDVLQKIRDVTYVGVSVSVPFWDEDAARAIEPFVASPKRRVETIRALARAGIPVTVNVAPLIPGLADRDMPKILEAAAEAGATGAAMIMLRLPGPVKDVFESRLRKELPLAADRVLARVREMRGGRLNDPRFGSRMTGTGEYADMVQALFQATVKRLGLDRRHCSREDPLVRTFCRPPQHGEQLSLFGKRG